ncbi:MAG: hypothetical protein PHH11_08815 [Methylomonas sp.]|nr:hypothetical protein [Methylomonas sp.]
MSNNPLKRRQLYIKKRFQGRLILGAFAVILLSGLCSALLIYWLTGDDLQARSYSAHINIAEAADRLGVSVILGNVVSIIVAGAVAAISVLYASHKIAGPLYRFELLCEAVGNGNLDETAQLREKDQLHALAEAFSNMLAKLRNQRKERSEMIARLNAHLSQLKSSPLTLQQQEVITTMEETLHRLDGKF